MQYAHARTANVSRLAREDGVRRDRTASTPRCSTDATESALLGALGEFPRIVAQSAELREPHRVARYLEELAGLYHRWYDNCRVLPATATRRSPTCTAPASGSTTPPARCSPTGSTCSASTRPTGCEGRPMRSHEAGVLHAEGYGGPPLYLPYPTDVMELLPQLLAADCRPGRGRSADRRRGRRRRPSPRSTARAAYVLDEDDFRSRAAEFRAASRRAFDGLAGADVYYAGKAFLCTAVARVGRRRGPRLDVCTGGELAVALRAGFPAERIGSTATTRRTAEIERGARRYGVGRIVVDSFEEIDRVAAAASGSGSSRPVMVRVTVGVEAHTHEFIATGARGPEVRLQPRRAAQAAEAVAPAARAADVLDLRGLHCHIGSQIFDAAGFEVAARRLVGLHASSADEHGLQLPELDLGGGFGIAYTSQHTPLAVGDARRRRSPTIVGASASATATSARAAASRSSRAAPSSARARSPSTRSAPSRTSSSAAATSAPTSRVDGGMSDNARPALYGADYSARSPTGAPTRRPRLSRVVGQALRERGHRRPRRVPARRRRARRPPRRARRPAPTAAACRAVQPHRRGPPVVAVRDGEARVIVRARDRSTTCSPSTLADARVERRRASEWTPPMSAAARCTPARGPARLRRRRLAGRAPAARARRRPRRAGRRAARARRHRRPRPQRPRPRRARRPRALHDRRRGPRRPGADVVIEVIGGIEPARALILQAIEHGASVVTANKALLAEDGPSCTPRPTSSASTSTTRPPSPGRSRSSGRSASRSPATACGGSSASSTARRTSSSTRWTPTGAGFDEAVEQAQALGYAEADPTADVEGFDAAAKAAILASLAFHTRVSSG